MSTDPTHLRALADECVDLVSRQFGHRLDWSPESLSTLDGVCADLIAVTTGRDEHRGVRHGRRPDAREVRVSGRRGGPGQPTAAITSSETSKLA
ncbi:hypothetical protein O7600_00030 [Micromonospora sp. WMMA1998]|uniref:hypothetical protein n=1 Tax=Micromonospora sp. WMMA1998 TaxID=3015167 RepID=UPI00248D00F9|nr:hypothetical protein [Micromonospora sp. WMMA1998]WBC15239.1 hypothetical protein O7600_29975 [Micromonospora sp. WMMA1998]WBC15265.1 hypothetical protein O7600_00030 [Micromonospora sp. WMMA1998]